MNIITHQPTSEAGRQELAQKRAEAHAQAIICCLNGLACPREQKLQILKKVIGNLRH